MLPRGALSESHWHGPCDGIARGTHRAYFQSTFMPTRPQPAGKQGRAEPRARLAMHGKPGPFRSRWPLYRLASAAAASFDPLAGRLVPWFAMSALLFAGAALAVGLWFRPPQARLGDEYYVLFVHLPAAWISLLLYLVMAGYAALALLLRHPLPALLMTALAPTGAMFAMVTLWTRSLSAWDARLACDVILLLLYLGLLAIRSAIEDPGRADRACAVLVLVGALNIPIIYFSAYWWNSLHHGAAASLLGSPAIVGTMLAGVLLMALAFWMYAIAVVLARARCLMLERSADPDCITGEGTS